MGKKSRRKKPTAARVPVVIRAFEGLPCEGDWIALREFVSSATATITLRDGRRVRIVTLLPGVGAGVVRPDGEIWVSLQVVHHHGDVSRDLAHVIELAGDLEPGTPVKMTPPEPGARLQDLIAPDSGFDIEVHEDFSWWLTDEDRDNPAAVAALGQANASVTPSHRVADTEGAWITRVGEHTYLRWVITETDEDRVLDGLARLKTAGTEAVTDGATLIGMFRAHGVLVPVWEVDGLDTAVVADAVPTFGVRLAEAIAVTDPLTSAERLVRQGLIGRQVTIR